MREVNAEEIRKKLAEKRLRVTPQRIAVFDAVIKLGNHPSADQIIEYVRKVNPNIAIGTVYNVLDTLTDNRLIRRVTTDMNVMRYDWVMEEHHHLYCTGCDIIEDYVDEELTRLLKSFFDKKKIVGFQVREFSLQIRGTFDKC